MDKNSSEEHGEFQSRKKNNAISVRCLTRKRNVANQVGRIPSIRRRAEISPRDNYSRREQELF